MQPEPAAVSLAELVATISLGTDLGLGQPMEHVMRQTLISLRMAERLGLDEADRTVVYYSGLLAWVGCHTDAYELTKWFGDDIAMKHATYQYDMGRPKDAIVSSLRLLGAGQSLPGRLKTWAALPLALRNGSMVELENHWRAADAFAARLGLGADVQQSLVESYERWDGKGPIGLRRDDILLTSRLVQLADVAAAFHAEGGVEAVEEVLRARRGTQLDPSLVDLFCSDVDGLLGDLELAGNWETVLAAAPHLSPRLMEKAFRLRSRGDGGLRRPQVAVHDRALTPGCRSSVRGRDDAGTGRCVDGTTRGPGPRPRPARRAQLDLGQAVAADRLRDRASPPAPLSQRADAGFLTRPEPTR